MTDRQSDRGRPSFIDPKTGEVRGSGAGAADPDGREDYDSDLHQEGSPSETPAIQPPPD